MVSKSSTSVRPQPLASAAEVAGILAIPEKTLAEWRSRGIGPEYLKIGRYVRYSWSAVNEWLATRQGGKGAA
jgi:predicted DNA-binding transcriptional regulator AlpA